MFFLWLAGGFREWLVSVLRPSSSGMKLGISKRYFKTVGVPAPRRNLKSVLGLVVVCPETVVALWGIFLSASPTSMKQWQHREHVAVDYHSPVSEVGMASVDWWGWWWRFWWSLLMYSIMIFVSMYIYIYYYHIPILYCYYRLWWWWWCCFSLTELASMAISNPAQTQPWGSDAFWGMVDMRATWQRQVVDVPCLEQNLPF